MKLPTAPWKSTWHDERVSEKFFQELAKLEKGLAGELTSSAKWIEQVLIELGQLAQNMSQLETDEPHAPQVRLAFEKALKLAALTAQLSIVLHRASQSATEGKEAPMPAGMAAAVEGLTQQIEDAGGFDPDQQIAPMRRTIRSLSQRGVPVAEIEIITGHPRHIIEAVLSEE